MKNYDWACQACGQINLPESNACSHWECPAHATGYQIEQYKKIADNLSLPASGIAVTGDNTNVATSKPEPYFTVSTTKLVLMSLCTFSIYMVYWFYRNWKVIKNYTPNSEIMPFWRAVFCGIWAYSCFREIRNNAHEIERYKKFPAGYLAIGIIVLSACQYLPTPFDVLMPIFVFLPIIPANNMAIAVNRLREPDYVTEDEFSTWNKVVVWIGSILWLLVLLGLKINMHQHS